MSELPEPLTPADCDLRRYPWMPLDVTRLLTSETWVLGSADQKVACITLWLKSWHQVPAGSLPAHDGMLCHLSEAGSAWKRVRDHALRGWIKCSDGRLYHPVVCEKARESNAALLAQKARTEAARLAKQNKKVAAQGSDTPPDLSVTEAVADVATSSVTENVAEVVTASTRQDKTREERKKEGSELRSGDPSPSADVKTALFREGVPKLRALIGRSEQQTRTHMGSLLKKLHGDCAVLLAIIREAHDLKPIDPLAWIEGAVRHRTQAKPSEMELLREEWKLPPLQWHNPPADEPEATRLLQ